jgi:hypothetical protein
MFVLGRAEKRFECPGCGLKYRARKEAMPLVRSGRFDCISCNAEIHEWSGFYDYITIGGRHRFPTTLPPGEQRRADLRELTMCCRRAFPASPRRSPVRLCIPPREALVLIALSHRHFVDKARKPIRESLNQSTEDDPLRCRPHLLRAMCCGRNGQPNFRARSRIVCWPRLKAPQARTSDAPSATSAFSRSSSSGDHGRDIGRISTSEDNRANREDGRAHPNVGGNSLPNRSCPRHGQMTAT